MCATMSESWLRLSCATFRREWRRTIARHANGRPGTLQSDSSNWQPRSASRKACARSQAGPRPAPTVQTRSTDFPSRGSIRRQHAAAPRALAEHHSLGTTKERSGWPPPHPLGHSRPAASAKTLVLSWLRDGQNGARIPSRKISHWTAATRRSNIAAVSVRQSDIGATRRPTTNHWGAKPSVMVAAVAMRPSPSVAGRRALERAERLRALRRHRCAGQRQLRRGARPDRRPDRPQRRRQDHALQLPLPPLRPQRRATSCSTAARSSPSRATPSPSSASAAPSRTSPCSTT